MRTLFTNKIILKVEYTKLQQRYDIFRISKDNKEFIDYDFLVSLKTNAPYFISYTFSSDRENPSCYVLFEKDSLTNDAFNLFKSRTPSGSKVFIRKVVISELPVHLLVQLFTNALHRNASVGPAGKYFCVAPGTIKKKKSEIVFFDAIEYTFSTELEVDIIAHRFSCLKYKEMMFFNKRSVHDYPKYKYSLIDNTLVRVSQTTIDDTTFIMKPLYNDLGHISFLDISSKKTFLESKIGFLATFVNDFKSKYGDLFDLAFEQIFIDELLQPKRKDVGFRNSFAESILNQKKINIVNFDTGITADICIKSFSEFLTTQFSSVEIVLDLPASSDYFNFIYLKPKDFYSSNGLVDTHTIEKSVIIQHFTENIFDNNLKLNASASYGVVKEALIKNDIIQRRVALYDWLSLKFFGYISFGIKHVVMDHYNYSFISISHLGEISFYTFQDGENCPAYFIRLIDSLKSDKVLYCVCDQNENINVVEDTRLFPTPYIKDLYHFFNNVRDEYYVKKLKLEKICSEINLPIDITAYSSNDEVDVVKLSKTIKNKGHRASFNELMFATFGIRVTVALRNKVKINSLFGGLVDINFMSINDKQAYYCVGSDFGTGMNSSLDKGSVIRKISAINDSDLFFRDILTLMEVDFVKLGGMTVLPFPIKYLREYITMLGL